MSRIAIDLGGTNLRVALVGDEGIISQVSEPCKAQGTENEVIEQICGLIDMVKTDDIASIGIAVPSVVDFQQGIVYNVVNIPSWQEVHLKQILESRYHVPAWVDNDVNCFVAGEKAFGAGRGFHNIVGITLGTGVGAGIVVDDKVYRGSNTGAGEIGCLPYLDGIYEDYTSSQLFKQWNTTGKEESDKADAGDPEAIARWETLGYHLGKLLQVILYTYDPEAIIIGGGIAQSRRHFEKAMMASLHEGFMYPHEAERVKIIFSELKDCNILGASALA